MFAIYLSKKKKNPSSSQRLNATNGWMIDAVYQRHFVSHSNCCKHSHLGTTNCNRNRFLFFCFFSLLGSFTGATGDEVGSGKTHKSGLCSWPGFRTSKHLNMYTPIPPPPPKKIYKIYLIFSSNLDLQSYYRPGFLHRFWIIKENKLRGKYKLLQRFVLQCNPQQKANAGLNTKPHHVCMTSPSPPQASCCTMLQTLNYKSIYSF